MLNTASGLGVTSDVKSWLITAGMIGVEVNSGVCVIVGVTVTVGVMVTVGVKVTVGVNVTVGEGWKTL